MLSATHAPMPVLAPARLPVRELHETQLKPLLFHCSFTLTRANRAVCGKRRGRLRIRNLALRSKIMDAAEAARFITGGSAVGMSGFTGSGYPKAVPQALAARIEAEHAAGNPFKANGSEHV